MQPMIVLLVVLFGLFYLFLAIQTWRENLPNYRNSVLLMTMALAWLSFTYALELMSNDLFELAFFTDLEYISYALIPLLFLFFIVSYTGRNYLLTKRMIIVSCIIPVFIILCVWTNDLHHLYYLSTNINEASQFSVYEVHRGPLYVMYGVFTYVVFGIAVFLLLINMKEERQYRRRQSIMILAACMIPAIGTILQLTGVIGFQLGFVVIVAYYICGLIFYFGALRTDVFVIVPVASSTIVDNMSDVAIATDRKGRVVRANPSASRVLGIKESDILGKQLDDVLPGVISKSSSQTNEPLSLKSEGNEHFYDIQTSPLLVKNGGQIGTLYILRDITELENAKEQLKMANTKLNLISNITRHDMLNQLVVVRGFSTLLSDPQTKENGERYVKGINSAVITMEHLISFARDYQKFGMEVPKWNPLEKVLVRSRMNLNADFISITNNDRDAEVLCDQMLERVFYNLFDNSLRHGGHVTKISVTSFLDGDVLKIIVEDDGIGVPDGEKDKIFHWGFGKNTGLGLAMCQQILELSGWCIVENGIPGKGARFEIDVPKKDWRKKITG